MIKIRGLIFRECTMMWFYQRPTLQLDDDWKRIESVALTLMPQKNALSGVPLVRNTSIQTGIAKKQLSSQKPVACLPPFREELHLVFRAC